MSRTRGGYLLFFCSERDAKQGGKPQKGGRTPHLLPKAIAHFYIQAPPEYELRPAGLAYPLPEQRDAFGASHRQGRYTVSASLRSAQSRRPPDVVRPAPPAAATPSVLRTVNKPSACPRCGVWKSRLRKKASGFFISENQNRKEQSDGAERTD